VVDFLPWTTPSGDLVIPLVSVFVGVVAACSIASVTTWLIFLVAFIIFIDKVYPTQSGVRTTDRGFQALFSFSRWCWHFPLDAIDKRNGGRPAADDESDACAEPAGTDGDSEASLQQQLDAVAGSYDGAGADTVERAAELERDASVGRSDEVEGTETDTLRDQLRKAIAALEEVDAAL